MPGHHEMLTSGVFQPDLIPVIDSLDGWAPVPLFSGITRNIGEFSCHISVLQPGTAPHPPHSHAQEELLIVLDGEVEIIVPENRTRGGRERIHLDRGDFVYYPSLFFHTLEATGDGPATYLMYRWHDNQIIRKGGMDFGIHTTVESLPAQEKSLSLNILFEQPTGFLKRLHCHVSVLPPGAGYEEHRDMYDIAILVMEGEVETLGQRVGPGGVIFYAEDEEHGILNPTSFPARYLVFEFHGRESSFLDGLRYTFSKELAKVLDGERWKRKFRKSISKRMQRFRN
jgi:quercetin dioxygenase-like cupin family protein